MSSRWVCETGYWPIINLQVQPLFWGHQSKHYEYDGSPSALSIPAIIDMRPWLNDGSHQGLHVGLEAPPCWPVVVPGHGTVALYQILQPLVPAGNARFLHRPDINLLQPPTSMYSDIYYYQSRIGNTKLKPRRDWGIMLSNSILCSLTHEWTHAKNAGQTNQPFVFCAIWASICGKALHYNNKSATTPLCCIQISAAFVLSYRLTSIDQLITWTWSEPGHYQLSLSSIIKFSHSHCHSHRHQQKIMLHHPSRQA